MPASEKQNKTKQNHHNHILILNQEAVLQVQRHLYILLTKLQKQFQA